MFMTLNVYVDLGPLPHLLLRSRGLGVKGLGFEL